MLYISLGTVVDLESNLGLISRIVMFSAALIPIYFSFSLSKEYKGLSIVLSLFILIHGLYLKMILTIPKDKLSFFKFLT